jgi:hypothetical protein
MLKVGGVLYIESFSMWVLYLKIVGRLAGARSAKILAHATSTTPEGPRFFWAPA